jgi:hypothetical protein
VDGAGDAYITGPTENPDQFDFDLFVVKVNPAGSAFLYGVLLGGSDDDVGQGIAVDSIGNATLTGWTASTDFFPIFNAIQNKLQGDTDAFVCKLNRTGTAVSYSTFLGGRGVEFGNAVALDTAGNAYVTGETDSNDFPVVNPWPGSARGGLSDAFVTKISANGSRFIYSGYLGGSDDDAGAGIAVDAAGGAFVTGLTFSSNFPRVKPVNPALGGELDAFVARIGDGTAPATVLTAAPGPNANGWNNTSVTATLRATDELDGSGVKEIVYALSGAQTGGATVAGSTVPVTVTAEGVTVITYFARDLAGNAEAARTLTVRVDKTPPVITGARSPAARSNGWANSDVTVSFTCRDAVSGIATCPQPTVVTQEGVIQSVTGTAIDLAGNVATATVDDIRIDKTPPVLTFTGGGDYTVDQQVNITCSALDGPAGAASGMAGTSCQDIHAPAYTLGLGTHQVVSLAFDRAGNVGSGGTIFTVTVTFGSLCNLTSRFATNAGVAAGLCASLTTAEAAAGRGDASAKAAAIAAYKNGVQTASGASISADNAAILVSLAGGL